MSVIEFPPRESERRNVSLLSLNGTCRGPPFDEDVRALITFPREESD